MTIRFVIRTCSLSLCASSEAGVSKAIAKITLLPLLVRKKKTLKTKQQKKQVRKRGLFCKILETIEYSGKGFIEMEIPQLGFCHSVERLIKSRTNFLNVMKQTTIGQAFKKWRNFFKSILIKK